MSLKFSNERLEQGNRFANGKNLLDVAITHDDKNSAVKLLRLGLDVNDAAPGSKITPLMFAALSGRNWLAKWLISKGAKVDAVDSRGQTVFDYAKKSNTLNTDRFFRRDLGLN
ncbi:MAG: ankyrin repeat domain-containing protein [Fimbriimonadaceae bacterium]